MKDAHHTHCTHRDRPSVTKKRSRSRLSSQLSDNFKRKITKIATGDHLRFIEPVPQFAVDGVGKCDFFPILLKGEGSFATINKHVNPVNPRGDILGAAQMIVATDKAVERL